MYKWLYGKLRPKSLRDTPWSEVKSGRSPRPFNYPALKIHAASMNKVQWLHACLHFEKDTHKNACSWTHHHHLCKFFVCSFQCLERHHERHFGNIERPRNFCNAKYVCLHKVIFDQQVVESFLHGFVMSAWMRWPRTKVWILVTVIQSYVDHSYWGHNLHKTQLVLILQIHAGNCLCSDHSHVHLIVKVA